MTSAPGTAAAAPGMAGRPAARRAAAGRLPHRVPRHRHRLRRPARYTPEDDVRHIDWNVTARLDEPYVRQYTEDRELTAWLVLDRSASMAPVRMRPPTRPAKPASSTSWPSAWPVCSPRPGQPGRRDPLRQRGVQRIVPPRTGRPHVLRLAHDLTAARPPRPRAPGPTCAAMLPWPRPPIRRRSLVFVISDFIGDDGWEPALGRLTQRHEVVVIRPGRPDRARPPRSRPGPGRGRRDR